jgi:two-component system, OmpR family, sensor kinase
MVVAAALLVVTGLLLQISRHHLSTALDQRLRATADSFRTGPAHRITAPDTLAVEATNWLAARAVSSDEVVAVRIIGGDVLTTTGGLDLEAIPPEVLDSAQSRWWNLASGRRTVRALTVALSLNGRHVGTLVVAAGRAPVDTTLRTLAFAAGWAGGLGLLFATVLVFLAVRRTLAPLLQMSRQVDEVDATGDLSRRVGPLDPRDEVGRLADGFNRLLARVEAAFGSQRRFLADASHELRTPLTVARGQLELALTGADQPPPVRVAMVELDRMARIVEELLLLARLDEGIALGREPVEVELVVQEALLRGLRIAPRPSTVDAEPGLYALADPDRLLQVVTNLVVNAVQHAGPDARLTLRTRRHAGEVVIMVSDTGAGIPPDHLPHVFDRFYRARTGGGAGLGLAIASSLTDAMSGRIDVDSAPGAGTTFTVRLPVAAEPFGQ